MADIAFIIFIADKDPQHKVYDTRVGSGGEPARKDALGEFFVNQPMGYP